MRPMIYIAGPYTHPDPVANTREAILVGMALYEHEGAVPIVPHLSILAHLIEPRPVDFWYRFDLGLLERCDALLRLPGESTGADNEVVWALENGISVFTDKQELIAWVREQVAEMVP